MKEDNRALQQIESQKNHYKEEDDFSLDEAYTKEITGLSISTVFFTVMTVVLMLIALVRISDTILKWFNL